MGLGGTGVTLRISLFALWWHFPHCNATLSNLLNYLVLPLGFEFLESNVLLPWSSLAVGQGRRYNKQPFVGVDGKAPGTQSAAS